MKGAANLIIASVVSGWFVLWTVWPGAVKVTIWHLIQQTDDAVEFKHLDLL